MHQTRLFLKMTTAEHNILNVAKRKMDARSYRDLINTLLDGEYIDFVCNSSLTERALRKILVNLNQLSLPCRGNKAFDKLVTLISESTAILADWNNTHLQPVFNRREEPQEVQIRLSEEEKDIIAAAKTAAGFRTYCDLVIHLCCAYITDSYNLPPAPDYTLFNETGKALNEEAKYYNTYDEINKDALNTILDSLYELTLELYNRIKELGGHHVS